MMELGDVCWLKCDMQPGKYMTVVAVAGEVVPYDWPSSDKSEKVVPVGHVAVAWLNKDRDLNRGIFPTEALTKEEVK